MLLASSWFPLNPKRRSHIPFSATGPTLWPVATGTGEDKEGFRLSASPLLWFGTQLKSCSGGGYHHLPSLVPGSYHPNPVRKSPKQPRGWLNPLPRWPSCVFLLFSSRCWLLGRNARSQKKKEGDRSPLDRSIRVASAVACFCLEAPGSGDPLASLRAKERKTRARPKTPAGATTQSFSDPGKRREPFFGGRPDL